jgi:hypothetical protein
VGHERRKYDATLPWEEVGMELKNFIAKTLLEIIEGVRLAQSGEDGTNVNASMAGAEFGGYLVNVGTYGTATRVDFEVQVTAETSGGAGAKLVVMGIGAQGGANHTAGSANRISFSVPVRLPDGDTGRANRIEQERSAQYSRMNSSQGSDWTA